MHRTARRLAIAAALAVALSMALGAPTAFAADREPGRILVKFQDGRDAPARVFGQGDALVGQLRDGTAVVRLRGGLSLDLALVLYRLLPGIEYAEPDYLATADLAPPNDPSFGSQWALERIRATAGWTRYPAAYTPTGGTTIAVLDTGAQPDHPDLDQHLLAGANCLSGTCSGGNWSDDNGHGTHVSGIAAAETQNGVGVAGVAFTSSILPVKVLDRQGTGSYSAIAAGIDWAVARGARILNLSLSGSSFSSTLCNAVSRAVSSGAVVVAAAGNSGSSAARYPAACAGAVGVAATTSDDVYASYSNYGSATVFVSAPGSSVLSTGLGSTYVTMSGTSMASPHVAGLVALLLGQAPGRTPAQVKTILATTSDKIGGVS